MEIPENLLKNEYLCNLEQDNIFGSDKLILKNNLK